MSDGGPEHFVRLSGIPFSATVDEVAYFLAGCDIKGGKNTGVQFLADDKGNCVVVLCLKYIKNYLKCRTGPCFMDIGHVPPNIFIGFTRTLFGSVF